jgi:parvulin-like peptidyl-prolyl isomerase
MGRREDRRDVYVMPAECRAFYDARPENFAQSLRLRASHLFLAAPMETPPPIIDAKRELIESLSVRLARGEEFSDLVAAASEDEATKNRRGDLGYFSAFRMPPDFFGAVTKLRVGRISPPIRTWLGFHIVQLTDSKPAQQLPFDQARAEISATLESEKRQGAIKSLIVDLCARAALARRAGSRNANF